MLGSMGTKDGVVLYHIWYSGSGITLSCPTISGVTSCYQRKCWLTGVGLVTKPGCGRICCTCTPTCVINVFNTIDYREVLSSSLINCFNLSSTKGKFLNSCPRCWQYAHAYVISIVGCAFVISIFCQTCGHSMVPIIGTLDQTF
jgi:hypothetical protein